MKRFFVFGLILLATTNSFGQYPKWIIRFTDKNNSPYSVTDATAYLSAKSIERRTKYSITIDSSDLPVNPSYIDSVLSKGAVKFLSASKWLNQILIGCTDEATINSIKQLPFVISAGAIGKRITNKKRKWSTEHISNGSNHRQENVTDYYTYDNSYDQVHIHNGEFLHNKGFHGETMTIAVLDAGFNNYKTTGAFDSVRLKGKILGEKDFVTFDNSVNEDDIHGAYCLSTIAANWPGKMTGTAPEASFWLLRSENSASEYPIEEHNWVAAAEYADSAGADMISSSLGYYDFDDAQFNHSYADLYKNSTMVTQGAAYACRKGILVMSSAGNEGNDSWKYITFPADADSVCTTGAVNSAGQIASFSSYGYPGKVKPNVVSVGAGTVIASPSGPVYGSGTSFSNPNLAGLVACLWQAFPSYNNMTILDAVYKSADRYNSPDNRYGYGIPDMKKAYRLLKHQQNIELYGSEGLWATPSVFTSQVDIRFIGQVDSTATIDFLNTQGAIIATQNFTTEAEEVYTWSFTGLANLPGGTYTVRYTDYTGRKTVQVNKAGPVLTDWALVAPNPVKDRVVVYIKAPETGKASVRLLTRDGKVIDKAEISTLQNVQYTITLNKTAALTTGIYFIECINNNHHKTIKLLK